MNESAPKRMRTLMHLAAAIFAVSFILPSYRVFDEYTPGWSCALVTEEFLFELNKQSIESALRLTPSLHQYNFSEWSVFVSGASANHLFVIAYVAAIFKRFRITCLFAGLSALCAIGCLLPGQMVEISRGWRLGPGYFVWCAAPVLLSATTLRAARTAIMPPARSFFGWLLAPHKY